MKWTKDRALAEITSLIAEIPKLEAQRRQSTDHTRWSIRVLQFLEQVFGHNSRFYLTFAGIQWYESSSFIVQDLYDIEGSIDQRHQEAYVRHLGSAKGLLLAAKDELNRSTIDEVYEGKDTALESSGLMRAVNLLEKKLRKVIRETPSRERDIQNGLEALLIGADLTYSREADTIEYSSKTYIPDFTLPRLDLALEVKFCSDTGTALLRPRPRGCP